MAVTRIFDILDQLQEKYNKPNALGAKENEEILIGNTAQEYANHIIRLLKDTKYADAVAENGHEFVKTAFSWENSVEMLETLFNKH